MAITIICSMQVENFTEWKAGFDSHEDGRKEAGISVTAYQNVDDPNNAVGIGIAPSREVWDSFFSRPNIQQNMRSSGVIGHPEIKLLIEP